MYFILFYFNHTKLHGKYSLNCFLVGLVLIEPYTAIFIIFIIYTI